MLDIKKMTDRELLEQLLSNQVYIMQQIHRINGLLVSKHGADFSKNGVNKDEIFKEMINQSDDFWSHHNELNNR